MTQRITPLTEDEKIEWFVLHLPYRQKMLTTYGLITKDRPEYQQAIPKEILENMNICSAEASRIACRLFIEFMGLGTNRNGELIENRNYHKESNGYSYEIKIIDLGGKWVSLNDLKPNEKKLLERTNMTGHKATAHLTFNAPYGGEHEIIYDSVELINRLLKTHLYDIVNYK